MDLQAVSQARNCLHGIKFKGVKDRGHVLSVMLDTLVPPGLDNIAAEINGCSDETELHQLADHFVTRYRVHHWSAIGFVLDPLPQDGIIQLRNHSAGQETPMPDPELSRTHLIVTRILRATGLAEVLDDWSDDDYYAPVVLASDGSTNLPCFIEMP